MGRYLHITHAVASNEINELNELTSSTEIINNPAGPCPHCGSGQWWQRAGKLWQCRACKPGMPFGATTLTLPCHKVQACPVRDSARVRRMMMVACHRLAITPEELCKELEANGDLADLESGAVFVRALQQVAMTLVAVRKQL